MFSFIEAPLPKLTSFQPKSCKLKKINLPVKRADMKLKLFILSVRSHPHAYWIFPLSGQHVSGVLRLQIVVISARTQTGRQPLNVDLKRIDYIPFRGLLQAAGVEIKAVKAWVGSSVLTMRLRQRPKVNSAAREALCYSCARLSVILGVNQSQLTGNMSVSCFWPSLCRRSWSHVGVMSQQGEWRNGVLALAPERLC